MAGREPRPPAALDGRTSASKLINQVRLEAAWTASISRFWNVLSDRENCPAHRAVSVLSTASPGEMSTMEWGKLPFSSPSSTTNNDIWRLLRVWTTYYVRCPISLSRARAKKISTTSICNSVPENERRSRSRSHVWCRWWTAVDVLGRELYQVARQPRRVAPARPSGWELSEAEYQPPQRRTVDRAVTVQICPPRTWTDTLELGALPRRGSARTANA